MDGITAMKSAQNAALKGWLTELMDRGVSQRELARRLNVSASKLNRFVSGVQRRFYVGAHELESTAAMFASPLPPVVATYVHLMLDAERNACATPPSYASSSVPLYALRTTAEPGAYTKSTEPIDHLPAWPGAPLAGQYAVQVPDNRQAPAFRAGHIAFVSALRPAIPGDDVLTIEGDICRIVHIGFDQDVPRTAHWIVASTRTRG
jgi:transcriptional regulator with XRE-family HTH domain